MPSTYLAHRHGEAMAVILVDMDGVLADWETAYVETYRALYPDARIPDPGTRTSYRTDEPHARAVWASEGLYARMTPIAGAKTALQEIESGLGAEIRICSAPAYDNHSCLSEKTQWLTRHLGEKYARTAIFTTDKTLARGDILIDDKPTVTGLYEPTWRHVIYSQPYNQAATGPRLTAWADWRTELAPHVPGWSIEHVDYDPCHPWAVTWGDHINAGYDIFPTKTAAQDHVREHPHGPGSVAIHNHEGRCCRQHGTHSTPHRGCILQ